MEYRSKWKWKPGVKLNPKWQVTEWSLQNKEPLNLVGSKHKQAALIIGGGKQRSNSIRDRNI